MLQLIANALDGIDIAEPDVVKTALRIARDKKICVAYLEGHALHFAGQLDQVFLLPEGRSTHFVLEQRAVKLTTETEAAHIWASPTAKGMKLETIIQPCQEFKVLCDGRPYGMGLCFQQ